MIVGHQKQWDFLIESTKLKKLAHAYLFTGPSNIGKKKIAFEFAKFLNCQEKKNDKPCNLCQICYQIEKKIWPNLIFIEPQNSIISIEEVRRIKEKLSLSADKNFFKVVIIDQAHFLTFDAQSAFLKILEEPKGRVVIILISEYPKMILETIRSRCQPIQFHLLEKKEIFEFLKEKRFLKEDIDFLLWLTKGKPGLLYKYIESSQLLNEDRKLIQDLLSLKNQPLFVRFNYVKKLEEKNLADKALYLWLNYFRSLMLSELNSSKSFQFFDKKNLWSKKQIIKIINLLQEIKKLLSTTNINQRLALEILLMEI